DRMPALRTRETSLKNQIAALDAQAADRETYLKLADSLEDFLARLRGNARSASTEDRQRVLRALVQDVLVGPEKVTIRHRIPVRERTADGTTTEKTDTESDMRNSSLLRWGRDHPALRAAAERFTVFPVIKVPGSQHVTDEPEKPLVFYFLRQ